jgi:hypothetical protein
VILLPEILLGVSKVSACSRFCPSSGSHLVFPQSIKICQKHVINNLQSHLIRPFIKSTPLNPHDLFIFYLKTLDPVMNGMNIVFLKYFTRQQRLLEIQL